MNKKFLAYILNFIFLLNIFANTTAMATCTHCRYTDYYLTTKYIQSSSSTHYKVHVYKRICNNCNKIINRNVNGTKTAEVHKFNNSKCSKCGYMKSTTNLSNLSINIKVEQNTGDGNIIVGGTYNGAEKVTIDVRNLTTNTVIRNQTCFVDGSSTWYYNKPVEAGTMYRFAVKATKGDTVKWAEIEVTAAMNAALQQALDRANYLRNYVFKPKNDISDGKRIFYKDKTYQGMPYSMKRTLIPSDNITYQDGQPTSYKGFDCSQFISYVLGFGGSGYITQTFNEIAYSTTDDRLYVVDNSGDIRIGDIFSYGPAGAAGHVVIVSKIYQSRNIWYVEYINQQGSIGTDVDTGIVGCTIKRRDTLSNFWKFYITDRQTYSDRTANGHHLRVKVFYP